MTSLLWLNNAALTLVWKGLKHNALQNGQASTKGLVLQGAIISEKDAPQHYMRVAVRGPQHCGHRF